MRSCFFFRYLAPEGVSLSRSIFYSWLRSASAPVHQTLYNCALIPQTWSQPPNCSLFSCNLLVCLLVIVSKENLRGLEMNISDIKYYLARLFISAYFFVLSIKKLHQEHTDQRRYVLLGFQPVWLQKWLWK